VEKRRKLVGYEFNNKPSPYSLSQSFNDRVNAEIAEEVSSNNVFQFESPSCRDTTIGSRKVNSNDLLASNTFKKDIKHRKSIHQSIGDGTNELIVGSRKRLNIPFTSGQPVDRSISEPPRNRTGTVFGKSRLNVPQSTTSATIIIDENDDDLNDDISINDIDNDNDERNSTANGGPSVTQNNNNESVSETSSEGCFSVPPMTTHSDLFKNRLINRHSSQSRGTNTRDRLSSFMGNRNNMNLSASTGELNFSKHLETDKSLFTERNVHSAMSALNRPSFNASLYGSNSSLNSAASSNSRMFHVNSPFYLGKTMYGGASAATATYSRRDLNMHSALRVPVQMRPSSSLSNRSSSNVG
jgi:nuclear pore complex protein Nup153